MVLYSLHTRFIVLVKLLYGHLFELLSLSLRATQIPLSPFPLPHVLYHISNNLTVAHLHHLHKCFLLEYCTLINK